MIKLKGGVKQGRLNKKLPTKTEIRERPENTQ